MPQSPLTVILATASCQFVVRVKSFAGTTAAPAKSLGQSEICTLATAVVPREASPRVLTNAQHAPPGAFLPAETGAKVAHLGPTLAMAPRLALQPSVPQGSSASVEHARIAMPGMQAAALVRVQNA